MKLVRNTTEDGSCKYALIRLDKIREAIARKDGSPEACSTLLDILISGGQDNEGNPRRITATVPFSVIELGKPGSDDEFFVIKLQDVNAPAALEAYAKSAWLNGDEEFARDVTELALRSGPNHPKCKKPD